jgi:hypothetical protein
MNNTTQQLEAIQRMMLVPDSAALQDNVRSFCGIDLAMPGLWAATLFSLEV